MRNQSDGTTRLACFLLTALLLAATAAPADEPAAVSPDPGEAAWAAARAAMVRGPAEISLKEQGTVSVPEGFGWVPTKESAALMTVMGNRTDERFVGLVFPLAEDASYFVSVEYEDAGYVKDDEARDWDADELLQSLKDGTESANEERIAAGIRPIKVTRWVEPPAYDQPSHRLVWSAEVKLRDAEDDDPGINYNTYVLGREGYFSANLVTQASTVAQDKVSARPVLEAISFGEGKRYADFDASSDKVAAYGLTALVAGVAAKKLGFLALAAAFVAKFIKLIGAAVVAIVVAIRKFLGGKSGTPGTTA
jgi:uncharacterized membrane-anchored protein